MNQHDMPVGALGDNEVHIVPADYTLKKMIGEDADIKEYFSGENIVNAQNAINQYKDKFLEWVMKDIAALEEMYGVALATLTNNAPAIEKLARTAFIIKSQAGTFGFDLASRVAKSLDDYCARHTICGGDHMLVIRKHIDTLLVIFHKNITADGGTIGKELLANLSKLVEKYK
jgi:hypothetical protein